VTGAKLLERLSAMGAAAQAAVPGIYAWGVTVAPGGWARSASALARATTVLALVVLGVGVWAERRWGERARIASVWAFVVACSISWSAAPRGLSAFPVDAPSGLAGMLGWALFAFASFAPAAPMHSASTFGPSLREKPASGDMAYLACGALMAGLFELIGWRIANTERALLVRFVALAAGLATIGASAQIALSRRLTRTVLQTSRRLRRAMAALVVLGLLALSGLLVLVLD
jgi:hypothetical protein